MGGVLMFIDLRVVLLKTHKHDMRRVQSVSEKTCHRGRGFGFCIKRRFR